MSHLQSNNEEIDSIVKEFKELANEYLQWLICYQLNDSIELFILATYL